MDIDGDAEIDERPQVEDLYIDDEVVVCNYHSSGGGVGYESVVPEDLQEQVQIFAGRTDRYQMRPRIQFSPVNAPIVHNRKLFIERP